MKIRFPSGSSSIASRQGEGLADRLAFEAQTTLPRERRQSRNVLNLLYLEVTLAELLASYRRRYPAPAMATDWDAQTYDQSSEPQRAWAAEVLARLEVEQDATVIDVGCGSGRVTEALLAVVPHGRVLAIDASADMVALTHQRLGERVEVWCEDALELDSARRSTRSSRRRRCTGSPTTTASGNGWLGLCDRAAIWRCNVEAKAISLGSTRSSRACVVTSLPSSPAGGPACMRA
jgi:hypothetical protein